MQRLDSYVTAADGVRTHFEVEGAGDALVLLHGFAGSTRGWHRYGYVEALKDSHQVVLVDARGHGQSDKPHDVEAHLVEKRAVDVLAVLDALDIPRAHVWGYSMGGRIALEMGRSHPARVRTLIVGGMSANDPGVSQREGLERRARSLEARALEARLATIQANGAPEEKGKETRSNEFFRDAAALAASMWAVLLWRGVEDDLPRMAMPTLMYCGQYDGLHAQARKNVVSLPDGRFVSLPGLNHRQAFQQSDLVLPYVVSFFGQSKA